MAPHIGGMVVGSQGQPLGGLPIQVVVTTSPRGELYGHSDFHAVTGPDGAFSIARDPAAIGALAFRAEAAFPWRGGTWTRDLLTTQGNDPQHLVFRASMSHTTDPFDGSWVNPGPEVRITDVGGCTALGADPDYPVSDPNTQSITFVFVPDGPLLDGTTSSALTWRITDKTILCGQGAIGELPAGAWKVSAVTDTGRPIVFATSGSNAYTTVPSLFEAPSSESSPTEQLNIAFGN